MRKTIPAVAMTALALAVATLYAPAQAATGSVMSNPGRSTVSPTTTAAPSNGTVGTSQNAGVFSPSAPGTLSSSTPPNSSTSPSSTTTTNPPMAGMGSNGVTATGPAAANVTSNPNSTNANPDPFGPGSTFANDNGNPELGQSPGQSSSGTLAGNSSNGIGTGTETLGNPGGFGVPINNTTNTTNGINGINGINGFNGATVLPSDVGGGGGVAYGVAAPGNSGGFNANVAIPATTATPLLNQVTRNEIDKQARQRAQGRTPQVIGIAPRTNVDRTSQMPDDPIIRY